MRSWRSPLLVVVIGWSSHDAALPGHGATAMSPPAAAVREVTPHVWAACVAAPDDEADPRGFVFRVFREPADSRTPVSVRLSTRGSMTPGLDFVAPPPRVVMPAGAASVDVRVMLIDDNEAEGPETIELVAEAESDAPTVAGERR